MYDRHKFLDVINSLTFVGLFKLIRSHFKYNLQ
jgi:hypothetical protein